MEKRAMLYSGKAKMVYKTEDENIFMVEYRDDATALNGLKKGSFSGKGIINNQMSNMIFKYLGEKGIPNHFIEEVSERETLVKKVSIIPLEVIVRNIAAGSFSTRYGVEEGAALKTIILEYSYKNDALGDPLINEYQALAIGLATQDDLDTIAALAFKINEELKTMFLGINLKLIDFKLEFGKTADGEIILADEISPDTCRLWQVGTDEKMDKDRFRRDLGGFKEAYEQVFARLSVFLS